MNQYSTHSFARFSKFSDSLVPWSPTHRQPVSSTSAFSAALLRFRFLLAIILHDIIRIRIKYCIWDNIQMALSAILDRYTTHRAVTPFSRSNLRIRYADHTIRRVSMLISYSDAFLLFIGSSSLLILKRGEPVEK